MKCWPVHASPEPSCADYNEGIGPNAGSGGCQLAPGSGRGSGKPFSQSRERALGFRRIGWKRRLRREGAPKRLGHHFALEFVQASFLAAHAHSRHAAGVEIDDAAIQPVVRPAIRLRVVGMVNLRHETRLRPIGDSKELRMHCTYALFSLAITVVERNSNRAIEMEPFALGRARRLTVLDVPPIIARLPAERTVG